MSDLHSVPAAVYHGTPFGFDRFRESSSGIHFGTLTQATHRLRQQLAKIENGVSQGITGGDDKGYILKCRLQIRQLKTVKDPCTAAAWRTTIESAIAEGFDGLVYENWYEAPYSKELSWVVFNPGQIEIL